MTSDTAATTESANSFWLASWSSSRRSPANLPTYIIITNIHQSSSSSSSINHPRPHHHHHCCHHHHLHSHLGLVKNHSQKVRKKHCSFFKSRNSRHIHGTIHYHIVITKLHNDNHFPSTVTAGCPSFNLHCSMNTVFAASSTLYLSVSNEHQSNVHLSYNSIRHHHLHHL